MEQVLDIPLEQIQPYIDGCLQKSVDEQKELAKIQMTILENEQKLQEFSRLPIPSGFDGQQIKFSVTVNSKQADEVACALSNMCIKLLRCKREYK